LWTDSQAERHCGAPRTAGNVLRVNIFAGNATVMKRLTFAAVGAAALALGGCGGSNEDQVNNAVLNQPNAEQLNNLAEDAANDAANMPAPEASNATARDENASAPVNNSTNPDDDQEQNVSGM
jgi:hypothetical protein